jgi:esterase/lipase
MVRALTNMKQVMNMTFVQQAITNNINHVNIPILVVAKDHKDQTMDEET